VKKSCILLIVILTLLFQLSVHADEAVFRKIIEDYLSVTTIKASIVQHIYPEDGSTEFFSGNYFAASKGFIRIDYIKPERQTIVVNDSGLYWYYTERKLLFHSGRKSGGESSIPLLMNVIPAGNLKDIDVKKEGMRFYSLFKMADVYSIKSVKNKTTIKLWVDPVARVIKRKIILDDSGREMIKEEYTAHAFINGVYIPSRIELTARTASGVIQTVTEYSSIVINSRIDKDIFEFKITPEMKVRMLDER
jgi:outer membrane lipoprotein-sorting protein